MPGFNLSHKKPHSKPVVDQFCLETSKKLRDFVKKMRWSPISRTPKKWSDSVRLLRNDLFKETTNPEVNVDAGNEYVINSTLGKYITLSSTIGFSPTKTGGFPRCKDMAQFRRCWDWINNVIQKHEKNNPTVTVSDQAKSITIVLRRKSWPASCLDKLETAVQVSLDSFNNFAHDVKMDHRFHITDSNLKKFYSKVLDKLGTPGQFVTTWFEDVNKRIAEWSDWHGNLMLEVFTTEKKQFHKWGKGVSVSWSGKTDLWTALTKRLGIEHGA